MKRTFTMTALFLALVEAGWQSSVAFAQTMTATSGSTTATMPPPGANNDSQLQIFQLKYADAGDLSNIVKRLFPSTVVEADPRTNALILNTDKKTMDGIGALIERL